MSPGNPSACFPPLPAPSPLQATTGLSVDSLLLSLSTIAPRLMRGVCLWGCSLYCSMSLMTRRDLVVQSSMGGRGGPVWVVSFLSANTQA